MIYHVADKDHWEAALQKGPLGDPAGAIGVAHVLRLLRDELEIAMALCGCTTLAQASRALLLDQRP